MGIIKLANDIDTRNTTSADYVIPGVAVGTVGGAGLGALSGSGYVKNKKINPKKALTGAVGGAAVGALGGIGSAPVTSRIGNVTKYVGDKATGGTDKISDEGKSALTSGLVGGAAGTLVGKRLKKTKGLKGKTGLKGGLIGAGTLGAGNYAFEKSVQSGKERRDRNKLKRQEYNELKQQLKELE